MNDNLQMKDQKMKEVFCRCIHRNGKAIYPRNKRVFRFLVPEV